MILILSGAAMLLGFLLELIVGWPGRIKHPIVLIGALISGMEKLLRRIFPKTHAGERCAGAVMAALVPVICLVLSGVLLFLLYLLHPAVGAVVETLMFWSIFAAGSLKQAAFAVSKALERGLEEGRHAVSMIVGRDTDSLTKAGVIKATVETVAENTSDGVIAPALFSMIGGAPLGYFYKAVNTMDSMCGYKNDRYMYYGTGCAVLDDVCNFVPARLCALGMISLSGAAGLDKQGARRIFRRDRYNHASPNSAQTESVMAGALGVQLGGDAYYFGTLHEKPTIGDDTRPVNERDIGRSTRLMTITSFTLVTVMSILRVIAGLIIL